MRTCNKCNVSLDESKFGYYGGTKYLRPECRECNNKLAKVRKDLRARFPYPEDGYTCPICSREEHELKGLGGNASVWVADHNHDTDTFRGYLCHSCNRAIGSFKDNVQTLQRAIDYLSK